MRNDTERDYKKTALVAATAMLLAFPMMGALGLSGTSKGKKAQRHEDRRNEDRGERSGKSGSPDLSPYEGLGAWIDMFNGRPWRYPNGTISEMASHGVSTLYLQTSNYSQRFSIYEPDATSQLIEAAHAHDMKVVAWYVPAFKNIYKDMKRIKAAIRFETASGQRFDSFALDIEATRVSNIVKRNVKTIELSERIRDFAGEGYSLGAIIPDPAGQRYWPFFPYAALDESFDVFMPMGYYTYRTSGYKGVFTYTKRNIQIIREAIGDPDVLVHPIGGIAGRAPKNEVKAYVNSSIVYGAIGGSLYDYPIMKRWEWKKLQPLKKLALPGK